MSAARARKMAPDFRQALYTCPSCGEEQAQPASTWLTACLTGLPVKCAECGASIDALGVTYVKAGGDYFAQAT